MAHFTNFYKAKETFSRLRSHLVSCVEAFAFVSLKTTKLERLRVNILEDSCEIGVVNVTAGVQAPRGGH